MLNSDQRAFLILVKAGLWEEETQFSNLKEVCFNSICRLAQEQSVVGLIASGLEFVRASDISQRAVLQLVGSTIQIEQQNRAMNSFVAGLMERLKADNIHAVLVKGQGIAQCYDRPLWRACGDVDLLLSENDYQKADHFLTPIASDVGFEISSKKHISFVINGWEVELHGTLRSGLWKSVDRVLDSVQSAVFHAGKVRSWMNGDMQVLLPGINEDVVFVFAHILQHFFRGGIGLRQVCDWCRLLWTYRDQIDLKVLEGRLQAMGVMSEWKSFAALAVNYLGMPVEAMPFCSAGNRWSRKAVKVLEFIFETGNFGYNRDRSYLNKYPFLVYKAISFWHHCCDIWRYFLIFPMDAIRVWWHMVTLGVELTIKGKSHE